MEKDLWWKMTCYDRQLGRRVGRQMGRQVGRHVGSYLEGRLQAGGVRKAGRLARQVHNLTVGSWEIQFLGKSTAFVDCLKYTALLVGMGMGMGMGQVLG